jgi:hypothetical protein
MTDTPLATVRPTPWLFGSVGRSPAEGGPPRADPRRFPKAQLTKLAASLARCGLLLACALHALLGQHGRLRAVEGVLLSWIARQKRESRFRFRFRPTFVVTLDVSDLMDGEDIALWAPTSCIVPGGFRDNFKPAPIPVLSLVARRMLDAYLLKKRLRGDLPVQEVHTQPNRSPRRLPRRLRACFLRTVIASGRLSNRQVH